MYKQLTTKLSRWIYNKVKDAQARGCVIGLSGGVDSAVVAALCKNAFPNSTLGVHIICGNNARDTEDAELAANEIDIPLQCVQMESVFNELIGVLSQEDMPSPYNPLYMSNMNPRLRMTALYYYAQVHNYLVVGTANRSELAIGYYTKFGDGGVDILPIGNLVKSQVWELARHLGIPERIINKKPSAGLWEKQTDEGEIGVTYQQLDRYILTGQVDLNTQAKIDRLMIKNEHKSKLPSIPRMRCI